MYRLNHFVQKFQNFRQSPTYQSYLQFQKYLNYHVYRMNHYYPLYQTNHSDQKYQNFLRFHLNPYSRKFH
jgi:hypothetical protein